MYQWKVPPSPVANVVPYCVLPPDQLTLHANVDPEGFDCEFGEILAPAANAGVTPQSVIMDAATTAKIDDLIAIVFFMIVSLILLSRCRVK